MKIKIIILALLFAGPVSNAFSQLRIADEEHYSIWKNNQESLAIKTAKLSSGVSVEYAEQGETSGIPVIFLHGITDSWHSFESVFPLLPSSVHAFAISQRGHGDSEKPASGYAMKDFSNDVAAFLRDMKLGAAIIVGHSMGGVIAQQFALDHPSLCKGLVIVSSDAGFRQNPGMTEFIETVSKLKDPIDPAFADEFQMSTLAKPIEPNYYSLLVAESLKVPARVWKEALQGIMNVDFVPQLKNIQVPTLVFWGDKDAMVFRPDVEQLSKGIRNSTVFVYENTGHALHWEEPTRFVRDLADFINKLK